MEKEKIKINFDEIPRLQSGELHCDRTGLHPMTVAITFAAAILIGVSLTIHTALIIKAAKICKNDGSDILISAVLPTAEVRTEKEKTEHTKNDPKAVQNKEQPASSTSGNDKGKNSVSYINCDLSAKEKNAMALMNETALAPDLVSIAGKKRPLLSLGEICTKYGQDSPVVLIYHTHGTESYCDCADTAFRSQDTKKNVVAVGTALATELEKRGVGAIHLEEMFDAEDFAGAYDRSTTAVRAVLAANPSVQFILDIHRDSIDRNGEYVKCTSEDGEKRLAQLMFVVGTDEGGSGHAKWQDNLTVALHLQSAMWNKSDSIMRPIDLKEASFYQDTGAGALIVEFGSCGNTLAEAKTSAEMLASAIYEYLAE